MALNNRSVTPSFAIIMLTLVATLSGCQDQAQPTTTITAINDPDLATALQAENVLTVFKSPTCGCCDDWVDHMRDNGFDIVAHNRDNMHPIKQAAGLQPGLGSCHTAFINGYAIEGHVPAADVRALLASQPDALGLAVPGMPFGSPGMEMGDRVDAYDVVLYTETSASVFNHYPVPEQQ